MIIIIYHHCHHHNPHHYQLTKPGSKVGRVQICKLDVRIRWGQPGLGRLIINLISVIIMRMVIIIMIMMIIISSQQHATSGMIIDYDVDDGHFDFGYDSKFVYSDDDTNDAS